jgi:hypothetical protein
MQASAHEIPLKCQKGEDITLPPEEVKILFRRSPKIPASDDVVEKSKSEANNVFAFAVFRCPEHETPYTNFLGQGALTHLVADLEVAVLSPTEKLYWLSVRENQEVAELAALLADGTIQPSNFTE